MKTYVFVYGTLKRNGKNHHLLYNSKFIKECYTTSDYLLYDLGFYPAMIKSSEGKRIKGEIFEIDYEKLKIFDALECVDYGLYKREIISLEDFEGAVFGYLYCRDISQFNEIECFQQSVDEF